MHHAGRCIVTRVSDSMHARSGTTHGTNGVCCIVTFCMCICTVTSRAGIILPMNRSVHKLIAIIIDTVLEVSIWVEAQRHLY